MGLHFHSRQPRRRGRSRGVPWRRAGPPLAATRSRPHERLQPLRLAAISAHSHHTHLTPASPPDTHRSLSQSSPTPLLMDRVIASVATCCVLLVLLVHSGEATGLRDTLWAKPGCHRVGHTRKVAVPDCVEFYITTHACRGFCESWSVPSEMDTVIANPHQAITSVGQCCNIMETEDVTAEVLCEDGIRSLVFKSAKSCSCYHCKKG